MKIVSGHPLMNTEADVAGHEVRFLDDNGRAMFEVSIGKDGASIEVRAPDTCIVDGKLYNNRLLISPNVSNSITIKCPLYDE